MEPTALFIVHHGKRFLLELFSCGRIDYSSYPTRWHHHPVYHLILVTRGRHYFDYPPHHSELVEARTLILINPDLKHQFRQLAQERFEHIGLLFRLVDEKGTEALFPLQVLLGMAEEKCPPLAWCRLSPHDTQQYQEQYNELQEMLHVPGMEAGRPFKLFHLLYSLLEHFRADHHRKSVEAGRRDAVAEAMERQLMMHIGDPAFHLEQLAATLGLTPKYLSAKYCRTFGRTFRSVLRQKRMEQAQLLLHTTQLQIQEIAERCGFVGISSFSQCFRQQFGLSPLAYRQQKREVSAVFEGGSQKMVPVAPYMLKKE